MDRASLIPHCLAAALGRDDEWVLEDEIRV